MYRIRAIKLYPLSVLFLSLTLFLYFDFSITPWFIIFVSGTQRVLGQLHTHCNFFFLLGSSSFAALAAGIAKKEKNARRSSPFFSPRTFHQMVSSSTEKPEQSVDNHSYQKFANLVLHEEREVFDEDPSLGRNVPIDVKAADVGLKKEDASPSPLRVMPVIWPSLPIPKASSELVEAVQRAVAASASTS